MSADRPTRDSMSIEEVTVSNMWEIAAIVEILEQKDLCTKQDLFDIITELRKQTPRAKIPETAFPEPSLLTETENKIIDDILELLNKHGLTSRQVTTLLGRLGGIIEMGQRMARAPRSSASRMSGRRGHKLAHSRDRRSSVGVSSNLMRGGSPVHKSWSWCPRFLTRDRPMHR